MIVFDAFKKITREIFTSSDIETVYHYTTANGITGILNTNSIWLTESHFLNDPNEIIHGVNEFKKIAITILNNIDEITPILDKKFSKYIASRIVDSFDSEIENADMVFVASFCENGDLLSQWKGYGNYGEGFSIGFSIEKLRKPGILLGKAIYNKEIKQRIVNTLMTAYLIDKELYNRDGEYAYLKMIFNHIINISAFFKNEYFHEECEWRMVRQMFSTESNLVKLRASEMGVTPYWTVSFGESNDLIKKIYVGPKMNYKTNSNAIGLLIDKNRIVSSENYLQ